MARGPERLSGAKASSAVESADHRGPFRLDVHSHFVPDGYRNAATAAGHTRPDGFLHLPPWSAAEHVDMMDRSGIATSFLSISSPGVHFGDDAAARSLARDVNDEGHRTAVSYPGRFGHFASLPLPDVDGAVAELRYCYEHLDVDGVALLTNAGGMYLGDPELDPVFAELNDRHARVFLHPTSPPCWEQTSLGRPRPMIEFLFDTTRAVVNLVLNGTVARHPDIEFIIPHAGAALPVIADRVAAIARVLPDVDPSSDILRDLGRLHYDLAGYPIPRQFDVLLTIATLDHLHYGSDYPFTPEVAVNRAAVALDEVDPGEVDPDEVDSDQPTGQDAVLLTERLAANTIALFPKHRRHP